MAERSSEQAYAPTNCSRFGSLLGPGIGRIEARHVSPGADPPPAMEQASRLRCHPDGPFLFTGCWLALFRLGHRAAADHTSWLAVRRGAAGVGRTGRGPTDRRAGFQAGVECRQAVVRLCPTGAGRYDIRPEPDTIRPAPRAPPGNTAGGARRVEKDLTRSRARGIIFRFGACKDTRSCEGFEHGGRIGCFGSCANQRSSPPRRPHFTAQIVGHRWKSAACARSPVVRKTVRRWLLRGQRPGGYGRGRSAAE